MKDFFGGKKSKKDQGDNEVNKKTAQAAFDNKGNKNLDLKINDNNAGNNEQPANLTIHSIFVKDLSYEAPSTPQVFSLTWEPQVKFDIQVMRRVLDQAAGLHEVILHTTISTKLKTKSANNNTTNTAANNDQPEVVAFLIDVKLAGVFTVKGLQDPQLDRVLSTTAPTILFPYAAEAVASLVTRGGFPQFILPPIDFATLYQQRLAQENSNNDKKPQVNQDSSTVN